MLWANCKKFHFRKRTFCVVNYSMHVFMMTYDDVIIDNKVNLQCQFENVDKLKLALKAEWNRLSQTFYYARQHICYIARICYRPSISPSVRLSVTRVDQSKTVEVRIMHFSPYGRPVPLVFAG